ncbi:MAG TPA: hypothetical protein VFM82_09070, partial [Flavobacteriaceae bacterium]|nr:hypothetical protein [Flavobacteriaceae bacterium]
TGNDEFNWSGQFISNGIQTVNGKLQLIPDNANSRFKRQLGAVDDAKNRIRIKSNFIIHVPGSDSTVKIWFALFVGNTQIGEFSVYEENLFSGDNVYFNLDRIYEYSEAGNVELRIRFSEGFGCQIRMQDLEAINFTFCKTNIRTYFVIDKFLEKSLNSVRSDVKLHEWKVDDIETLTPAFFAETANAPSGNPNGEWYVAKADIDGANRNAWNGGQGIEPNTFNPFIKQWKLVFDPNNYYSGKPTGTQSGSDYGSGIMQIGIDKPEILNAALVSKKGAFFIDIDYSKNLRIVFDVVINNENTDVFNEPYLYRRYYILWNKKTCQKQFYYTSLIPELQTVAKPATFQDGFLFGLTDGVKNQYMVNCSQNFRFDGAKGVFEFQMDFGDEIGQAGINYDAYDLADKFEIIWNNQVFSSGYVGSDAFDNLLLNEGIPASEIHTGNPSTGSGNLFFTKDQAGPGVATIRVTSPLNAAAGWEVFGICPQIVRFSTIKWSDTLALNTRTGNLQSIKITKSENLGDVKEVVWERFDGQKWYEQVLEIQETTTFEMVQGTNRIRLKALYGEKLVYSNELKYIRL